MGKIDTLKKLWRKDKRLIFEAIFNNLVHIGMFNFLSDEAFLKMAFRINMRKKLNIENPTTFNEKLQWLKLYDRNPMYSKMVDKFAVKDYVKTVIGDNYIIATLGVWENVDDIDWDDLPDKFVLKCNHDSGGVVICKDKQTFDKRASLKKLTRCLKNNGYWYGREWPYKDVKPLVIAEQYLEDVDDLKDYKLMCFNGKVKCSFVCSDRFSEGGLNVTFFDRDWKVLPFERHYPSIKEGLPKPESYELMVKLAERLAQNIPFVRVDFYDIKGKIYFGELTFYPGSGYEEFTPVEWDYILGNWIMLPDKKI